MCIVRVQHNRKNPYVIIDKTSLWDENLSLEAVGLWSRLLSRPDDWHIRVTELTKSCGCGKEKINRILNELISNGYAYRYQTREKGKFREYETLVFETKQTAEDIKEMFPQPGFPCPVFQVPTNPQLLSKESTKERLTDKKESIPKKTQDSSPVGQELSIFLLQKLREKSPNFKEPNLAKWAQEMDLLLSKDNRSVPDVKRVIEWATSQPGAFWATAVLSPTSLRKQFDRALLAMNAAQSKPACKEMSNKEVAEKVLKDNPQLKDNIIIGPNDIEIFSFKNRSDAKTIAFKELGFREQLQSELRKRFKKITWVE